MIIFTLCSGSSGNATFINSGNTSILIDAGATRKKIEESLNEYDYSISDLDGVVVTHEHIDHIKGIGVMSRKDNIPIYASKGTIYGIMNCKSVGDVSINSCNEITDKGFYIGDLYITPVKTSHDANDSYCYVVEDNKSKAAIVTDTGVVTNEMVNKIQDVDMLLLETNHDIEMLKLGPYPKDLQRRIAGKYGHLSNDDAGKFLNKIISPSVKNLLLCHISLDNNYEELALETIKTSLELGGYNLRNNNLKIEIAPRYTNSKKYIL